VARISAFNRSGDVMVHGFTAVMIDRASSS